MVSKKVQRFLKVYKVSNDHKRFTDEQLWDYFRNLDLTVKEKQDVFQQLKIRYPLDFPVNGFKEINEFNSRLTTILSVCRTRPAEAKKALMSMGISNFNADLLLNTTYPLFKRPNQ